jgi:hypothetical protein
MLRQRQVNNILLATQSGPQIPLATEVQGLDFELILFFVSGASRRRAVLCGVFAVSYSIYRAIRYGKSMTGEAAVRRV